MLLRRCFYKMKAMLILVGTELLNGGMVDTNSIYMAEELNKYGIEIYSKMTVKDSIEDIINAIEFGRKNCDLIITSGGSIYMAEELNKYGIEIYSKMTVKDSIEDIINAIEFGRKNCDLIITSGGLGPTIDDITKEAVTEYLGKKLIVDEDELLELKEKFRERDIKFLDINVKEVEKPEGAVTFKNGAGMAPAVYIDGIVSFPGVPAELYDMFPKFLKWYAKEKNLNSDEIYIKDLVTYGIAESHLDNMISDLFTEEGIEYEFLVKSFGILIRMQSKLSKKNIVEKIVEKIYNRVGDNIFGEDSERLESLIIDRLRKDKKTLSVAESKNIVEKIVEKIYNRVGDNIFGEDSERLESLIIDRLRKDKKTLSVAESCTGGLLADSFVNVSGASEVFMEGVVTYSNEAKIRLRKDKKTLSVAESCTGGLLADSFVNVSGASEVFMEGVVTYSNEAKMERLGVKKETLEKFGAVSPETAREMVLGLKTDAGISVTGIAGPGGGTPEKPVGLVYMGIRNGNEISVEKKIFKGSRRKVRQRAVLHSLFCLNKMLKRK